jgi:hypothetical protein
MFSLARVSDRPRVWVDAPLGRPRAIRVGDAHLAVTRVEAMRDETAAYAPHTGPRKVFVVRSDRVRYRLVHLIRDGIWLVEELGSEPLPVRRAA